MGQEKGLVMLGGKPLISHVAVVLKKVADEIVVSTSKGMSERYAAALGRDCRIVEDLKSGYGPLEGLVNAFSAAKGHYAIVSPCDTPFISSAVCKMIVSRASGMDGAVPRVGGMFEPLLAAYATKSALHAFSRTLALGNRKPIEAYNLLNLAFVEEEELRTVDSELLSFWNINSPEDLRLAEEKFDMGVREAY